MKDQTSWLIYNEEKILKKEKSLNKDNVLIARINLSDDLFLMMTLTSQL